MSARPRPRGGDRSRPGLRVISGGQSGVDRAALDAALAAGMACGGWCPRGRRAEDGPIDRRYPLRETASPGYAERTLANVLAADATLVLTRGTPSGGTALTVRLAREHARPCRVVDLRDPEPAAALAEWIARHRVAVLNVAGPRESSCPGIAASARRYLDELLALLG